MAYIEQPKAFDLSRYPKGPHLVSAVANHAAALSLETAIDKPPKERINPFSLVVWKSRVIDDASGEKKDVSEHYSSETALADAENKAGLKIRECLLFEPDGTLSVWISPPGGPLNYEEGRLVFGIIRTIKGIKTLESYGICTLFSAEHCLDLARQIPADNQPQLEKPEDLRKEIFIIREHDNPLELLRTIFPLPEVWDSIESGEAKKLKEEARTDALECVLLYEAALRNANTDWERTLVGAQIEREMRERGRQINSGPCGSTNTDSLDSSSFVHAHTSIGPDGKVIGTSSETGNFVKNYGNCGVKINAVIPKGYRCPNCGNTYKGC